MTARWWERYPERLKYELEALTAAAIIHEINQESLSGGILRLRVQFKMGDEDLPLVVTFPDLYPYFRFEVEAPSLTLAHHQNPFGKNLCLIGRATHHWHTHDTVAGLLQQQLSAVLQTGRSNDEMLAKNLEEDQAEPFSDYSPYPPSMIIVQGGWTIPLHYDCGTFALTTVEPVEPPPEQFIRGALVEMRARNGELILQAEAAPAAFSGQTFSACWVRVPEAISQVDPQQFIKELLERFPFARSAAANRVRGGWLQIWGVLFSEEVGWRTKGEGWVFVCLFDRKRSGLVQAKRVVPRPNARWWDHGRKNKRRRRR